MKKILLFLLSVTFMSQIVAPVANATDAEGRQSIDISGHPLKGPANAAVTIAVYSDYQCPACRRLEPVVKQVMEKYPQDVKLVHMLLTYHDFSQKAVLAAYAAWDQEKFWEFHDRLFENQQVLNKAKVTALAKELKLDLKRFNKKMQDPAILKLIDRDMADVNRLGITGTPTVYINGKRLEDRSFQGFQTAIEQEMKK
jgi:protein-disulfide isomerase